MKIRGDDLDSIKQFLVSKNIDPNMFAKLTLRSPDGLSVPYIISYDTETGEFETGLFVLRSDGKMKPIADVDGKVVVVKGVIKGAYLAFDGKEIS